MSVWKSNTLTMIDISKRQMIIARLFSFLTFGMLAALICTSVLSDELPKNPHPQKDDLGIYTIAWENDIWSGTDRHYTNGNRFSYLSPETAIPEWLDNTVSYMPLFASHGRKRFSVSFGQSMFTPQNISTSALIREDRPYAGWLYGNIGLTSDTGYRLDNLELSLGIVGESALGKPVQKRIHKWVDSPDPKGWDNQLKDEPAIMLSYERKWRGIWQLSPFGLGIDVTPHLGGSVGNVFTQAAAGATLRVGFDLPADYGPPRIRPSLPGSDFYIPTQAIGGYLFAGVEGRGVAHNIFLDGNTYKDSHSVEREPWVGSLQFGGVVTFSRVRLGYTHVIMTEEFEQQEEIDQYGALTLSVRY